MDEMPKEIFAWKNYGRYWGLSKCNTPNCAGIKYVRHDAADSPKEVSAGLFILNTAGVIGEQNAEYIVKSIMSNFPNGIKIVEVK